MTNALLCVGNSHALIVAEYSSVSVLAVRH
jgi:hypothetical protein